MKCLRILWLCFSICFFTGTLTAQKVYYWNPSADNKSSNAANWHLNSCSGTTGSPGKNDSLIFSGCNAGNLNCTIDKSLTVAGVRLTTDYTGTVTANAGKKLTFKTGKFYGGSFTGNTGDINANSSLTINGCNFTSSSGNLIVKGAFTFLTGSFSHNNGTVIFKKGSGSVTELSGPAGTNPVNATTVTFNNLQFEGSGSKTKFSIDNITFIAEGDLTLTGTSPLFLNTTTAATVQAHKNFFVQNNATDGGGSATIVMSGTGDQKIQNTQTGNLLGRLSNITISKTQDTLHLIGTIQLGKGSIWEYHSGNVDAGVSKLICFNQNTLTNSSGAAMNFYDLEIQGNGSDHTVNGTVTVNHSFTTSLTGTDKINAGTNGGTIELYGDLLWNNTSTSFGNVSWQFSGSAAQNFSGSIEPTLYNVTMNKSDYYLLLQKGFSVSHQLNLLSGYIVSDSLHPVTIQNGATVINASSNSFVRGAVKKSGKDAFQFPIGSGLKFRPISISAPTATGDLFYAAYNDVQQTFGNNKDAALTYLSQCEYWTLTHLSGSSAVNVTMFWDSLTCDIDTLPTLRIARWKASAGKWVNTGNVTATGDTSSGSITTQSTQTSFGNFVIAKNSVKPIVDAGATIFGCNGTTVTLGGTPTASGGTPPFTYSWSPDANLSSTTVANPSATLVDTIMYTLTVTDDEGVVVVDSVHVNVYPAPAVNAGYDRFVSVGSSVMLASANPVTGGTAPFTYSWSPGTYLNHTNIAQPVSTPLSSITYTLTATDAHGCIVNDDATLMLSSPSLQSAGMFALLSGDSMLFTNPTLISARVGSRKFISSTITSNDTIVINSALDSLAIIDLSNAISKMKSVPGISIASALGGQLLTSGSYEVNGTASLNTALTLQGNSKSIFIINIRDSLLVNAGGSIVLDGVNRSQVYFCIGSNLRVSTSAALPGNFMAGGNISGGTISGASLLCMGKMKIASADALPALYKATLTSNSRNDAADFLGFNSSNLFKVADSGFPTNLSDHNDRLHMPQLNARVVRFPPGGHAKAWNINDGWFFNPDEANDSSQISYSPNLACVSDISPTDAGATASLPVNRLIDVRYCLGGSDAKLMLCLNMFTRTDFQKSILQHVVDLGINMPYIELGNEFYLKGGTCPWAQPEDYAAQVNYWINYIHNTPALAGVKVGFDGSSWTTEDDITDGDDCRRKAWDASVLPNLTGTIPGDAITYHIYPSTGIDNSKAPNVTLEDVPVFFNKAFTTIDNFSNHELKTIKNYPGLKIWVTEYNLTDKNFAIAGSWAHAMFLAVLTLRLLEFPEVETAECHTFATDAGRGLFFTDNQGYKLGKYWATIDSTTNTKPWAFTATGLSYKMITEAMRLSSKATLLSFPHAPLLQNSSHAVLYGWTFDKTSGDKQSILINLSDQPQQIDVAALQPADAYEQISCSNPLTFFTGDVFWKAPYNNFFKAVNYDYVTGQDAPVNFDSVNMRIPAGVTTILLPPYSITRLYALNHSSVWMYQSGSTVCASDANGSDTVHASTAVNMYAGGGAYYQWTVGETEKSSSSNISVGPFAPLINGELKVFDPEGNLIGTKTGISVSQNSLPPVTVTPASFDNSEKPAFTAVASGADAYNWMPSFGASSILGDSINIKPPYSQTYFVIGTSNQQCSKIEKVSTSISPIIKIKTSGGSLNTHYSPHMLQVCRGNTVTLTADANADYYAWTSNDSSVNGTGSSISFIPTKNVLITVEATNRVLNLTSRTSVYVKMTPAVSTDQNDYYNCANQFVRIHGSLDDQGVNTTFCWDDLMQGTSLYNTKSFSSPITENSCKVGYSSVYFNAPAGNYTMDFKAQDPDAESCPGTQNDDLFNVHLSNPPDSIVPPAAVCVINGGTVTLSANGGDNDFTWDGPGLQQSIGASVEVSPITTSLYHVTTSNQQCCVSDSVLVTVEQVTANCDGSIYCYGCSSKQVQVAPLDSANYLYQWFQDGIAVAGATDGIFTVTIAGNKTAQQSTVYCAVAKKDGSCAPGKTNEVKVTVTQSCNYQRNSSYNEVSTEAQSIFIYPNPAAENFYITFAGQNKTDKSAMLSVYDVMGKLVWKEEIVLTNGKYAAPVNHSLDEGMYLIRICTLHGCTSDRVIISH